MAKGAARAPGRAPAPPLSLRGLYGDRLARLRQAAEAEAEQALQDAMRAGADTQKLGRLAATLHRRRAATDYNIMIREFRREVSNLRKSGLVEPETRAGSAQPTIGLLRRIENNVRVARGEQRAVKVGRKRARELRNEGWETRGDKVILSPEFKVNPKKKTIERREFGFARTRRVYLRRPADELEQHVAEVFAGMGRDELVAMRVGEFNMTEFYHSGQAAAFLKKLLAYQRVENDKTDAGRYGLRYLTIVKVTDDEASRYSQDLMSERFRALSDLRRDRDKARAAHGRALRRKAQQNRQAPPPGKGGHWFTPEFGAGAQPGRKGATRPRKRKPQT